MKRRLHLQRFRDGYVLGFEASSDHISTHISYTNLWLRNPTRAGIIEAIQSRRTYAQPTISSSISGAVRTSWANRLRPPRAGIQRAPVRHQRLLERLGRQERQHRLLDYWR